MHVPFLKLTAKAPENGCLEIVSSWGPAYFQGRTVSFRECTSSNACFSIVICRFSGMQQKYMDPESKFCLRDSWWFHVFVVFDLGQIGEMIQFDEFFFCKWVETS